MLDNQVIVSSAVSTFNNAALWEPGFLWAAILALPLFALAWIMGHDIFGRFLSNAKTRERRFVFPIVLVMFVWAISHGNFGVIRDGTSLVVILNAIILWLGAIWLSRRYYESGARLSKFIKGKKNPWKKLVDMAAPPAVAIGAGVAAIGAGLDESLLQSGAVAVGIFTGYMLNRRGAREKDPRLLIGVMILLALFGLVMQPEFFRFGQLAHLSVFHLLFLCLTAAVLAAYFAASLVRPRGWFSDLHYGRYKVFMRAAGLFVVALLFITESALAFAIFCTWALSAAALGVLHAKSEEHLKKIKGETFLLLPGLFGILAALPVLTFIAIILWRQVPHGGFLKRIRELL
ncbi:MAG: hypothetical protein FWG39_03165 [Alphaproteobacteria bacterium]|nr:hypothetical protein [Alphaproteobacteria bacterium]